MAAPPLAVPLAAPVLVRLPQGLIVLQDPNTLKDIVDDYGAFTYIDDWGLTGGQQGVIIQEITRTLGIRHKDNNEVVTTSTINRWANSANFFLGCMHYWECFPVSAVAAAAVVGQQAITPDHFQSAAFRPPASVINGRGVKGTYTITGRARFYPTARDPDVATDRAALGLGRATDNVAMANGLVSTRRDPAAALALLFPMMAGVSNEVTRMVMTTWDSGVNDGDSVITIT